MFVALIMFAFIAGPLWFTAAHLHRVLEALYDIRSDLRRYRDEDGEL